MKLQDKIKELMKKLSDTGKKGLIIGAGALLVFAIAVAVMLNSGNRAKAGYKVLFSGLTEQESTEVMAKLQEEGIDYQYTPDGNIRVPEKIADQTRATLALAGYPKNGFTYETFLNNSSMMSTESDKKSLKVWEMQDRLGATIRSINGIQDAVVQIVPGETQKYVLGDANSNVPTASVMVTMKDGGTPSPEQVAGIQRLVAKAVANMDMGDVAVIDSNGFDVSAKRNDIDAEGSDRKLAFEKEVESKIEDKILNVLEVFWGRSNVRVSVKCTADMQKTISEENGYTAPDETNNSGYITHQELYSEGEGGTGAAGVPGAGTNTNVPQYNTNPGNTQNSSSYSSSTDYALNERKIQSQDDSGRIVDLTVAVSINSDTLTVSKQELTNMIAKAAGIEPTVQDQKIVIVNSEWYKPVIRQDDAEGGEEGEDEDNFKDLLKKYLPFIIAGAVALLILIILMVILLARRSKKKKAQSASEEYIMPAAMEEQMAEMREKIEIPVLEEQNKEMRDTIREFTDENPEISAQLLKNWLGGNERG